MNRELDKFLNMHLPRKGYHAHNGQIELYSDKSLSFQCGCGANHRANDSFAAIDFPMENKGVYVCPNNNSVFTLVKATGLLSIKGLKPIAFYKAKNEAEIQEIMLSIESKKHRG